MSDTQDMNRRDFVALAAGIAAAAVCAGALAPRVRGDDATSAAVPVGSLSDYPKDGLYMTYEKPHHIIIARESGSLYAMSSKCTHKGCDIKLAPTNDHFICPCHHAQYDDAGKVLHGPAKAPLFRYPISVDSGGKILVDTTQPLGPDHWKDAGASISVASA